MTKKSKKRSEPAPSQIAARVAPAPKRANVIKKVYAEGSPGWNRRLKDTTLTKLKNHVREMAVRVDVLIDSDGNIVERIETPFVDHRACSLRATHFVRRNLLGRTNIGSKRRHVRDNYAVCNVKKAA